MGQGLVWYAGYQVFLYLVGGGRSSAWCEGQPQRHDRDAHHTANEQVIDMTPSSRCAARKKAIGRRSSSD